MIDPPRVIAGRLEALRKELKIPTQEKFAAEIGLDKSTFSLIMNGRRNLSFETACRMVDKWQLSLDWIFYGDTRRSADQIMAKIGRGPETALPERPRKRKRETA
jgi:transcriptional regulator with XRE-family HTH domain